PLAPLGTPQPSSEQSAVNDPENTESQSLSDSTTSGTVDPLFHREKLRATAIAKPEGANEIFVVTCSVCNARVDVTRDQIGSSIACPDCYLSIPVHTPKEKPPETRIDIDNAEVFSFSDGEQAEELNAKTMTVQEKYAQEALEKARKELDSPKDKSGYIFDEYDIEKINANIKIFGFIGQPAIWPRWLMYSIGLSVILAIYSVGVSFYDINNLLFMFLSFFISIVGTLALALWILFVAPALLTIFNVTENGDDKVESFPSGAPQDFMSEFSILGISLLYSAAAGMGLALLGSFVGMNSIFGVALITVSAVVFHPVVFLSVVHSQSLLTPCSPDIVRTFSLAKDKWIRLYLLVALMGFLSWALLAPVLLFSVIFALPAGVIITLNLLLYFRLLGKLVYECGELMDLESVPSGGKAVGDESSSAGSV
ncbi:MAG: hypothetical protein ACI9G1_001362, partial [Pirellulaceae bacterium]